MHLEHVVRPPSDRYQHRCLCSSQWAGRRCSSYAKLQVIPDIISNVGSWPLYQSNFFSSIYIFCNSTHDSLHPSPSLLRLGFLPLWTILRTNIKSYTKMTSEMLGKDCFETGLTYDWFKSYDTISKYFHFFFFAIFLQKQTFASFAFFMFLCFLS